ncbi:PfkB family carbohydrate kinase [Mesorhizobium sp. DCY119]|uniref:PfkB family carbohydrate kinase n=1 Tax=Mesorhizobium sp. DCY119 TaxID=2108445 RepID=UPI000E6D495F|nr:PfkB family carbohydrate kinase [Mesorhizobium sp. DCY119]RJG46141.1 ribokinase [Mesorhizobium sp. DCY119]
MISSLRPVVVVVGSLHYDIMVDAPDRPRKGETVAGFGWRPKFGGKGGNQAAAAAKAGADVRMVGAVGDDDFGRFLLSNLDAAGVDASRVARIGQQGSGMSVAITDAGGDYGAVIVSGANAATDPENLSDSTLWKGASILALQNEMPEAVNLAAAKAARQVRVPVCLNAAPYRPLADGFAALVDILIVNAIEAEQFCGSPVFDLASARGAAEVLSDRFATVVVTVGGDGVVGVARGQEPTAIPAIPVRVVSTHGAGDVFVGGFATALAAGQAFPDCLRAANQAAAIHVST